MAGPALPEVAYERFAKPPLRVMLGQVQFPVILRLQKGVEAIADLQEAIRGDFPNFAIEHQLEVTVSATGESGEPRSTRAIAYRFTDEDETWSALVAPNALTIEAGAGGRYSSYEEFSKLFRTVWAAALEHLRPGKVRQQGLRYVDHLEGEMSAKEWAKWINPDLLGAMAGDVLGAGLEQAVCQLEYPREDGGLLFRHGLTPAGPQSAKGYLLDFDSQHTRPVEAEDVDTLFARFDESHELIYRFFRWCVTDEALEAFRVGGS